MSDLSTQMAQLPEGQGLKGSTGSESEWIHHGSLQLGDGRLLIVDLDFLPSEGDGLVVELPPGLYEVSGRVMDYPGDRRVSRLRVLPKAVVATLGESLGETWTDTGTTAVCDLGQMSREWEELGEDAAMSRMENFRDERDSCGVFTLGPGSRAFAPFVTSGFGDGTFPVFALLANGRLAGLEIEFIAVDEPYPFGEGDAAVDGGGGEGESEQDESMDQIGNLMATLMANRTGDGEVDRSAAKSAMEDLLGGFRRKALEAAAECRERTTALRKRGVVLQIHAVPITADWIAEPAIQERINALERAGFLHDGTYRLEEIPNYAFCGMYHGPRGAYATVERYGDGKAFLSLGVGYPDGREFEVSDTEIKPGLPRPPWNIRTGMPGVPPRELIEHFFRSQPEGPVLPVSAGGQPLAMQSTFRRIQLWRADRGGWTLPEIKLQQGLPESAEDTEELVLKRRDSADVWLCNWLRMQPELPFVTEEVLGQLVIIHDELPLDLLQNEWLVATGELSTRQASFAEGSPREAFVRVNQEHGSPLRLVMQKSSGLAADFYLPG